MNSSYLMLRPTRNRQAKETRFNRSLRLNSTASNHYTRMKANNRPKTKASSVLTRSLSLRLTLARIRGLICKRKKIVKTKILVTKVFISNMTHMAILTSWLSQNWARGLPLLTLLSCGKAFRFQSKFIASRTHTY